MNIKNLFNLYRNQKFGDSRILSTSTLLRYYIRLKIGEITKQIYKNPINSSSPGIVQTTEALEIIELSIRKTLSGMNLRNIIDVNKKIGFENIGTGCVLTPAMFGNLLAMSQSNTSFYFVTKDTREYTLDMNLIAIASVSGHVKFEEKIIHSFSISTLTERKISLRIKPELAINKISKITISVDKCWSPHFLDKELPDFPMGVGIRFISLL